MSLENDLKSLFEAQKVAKIKFLWEKWVRCLLPLLLTWLALGMAAVIIA